MTTETAEKVLVANQKGGVGKTSIVVSIALGVAAAGRKVLVLDCDQQGNLTKSDLGSDGDSGKNLSIVMQFGGDLEPVQARDNLHLIPGGHHLASVPGAVFGSRDGIQGIVHNLDDALKRLDDKQQYDLILFDSGPGDAVILDALLQISDWLLVPTRDDEASIDGVKMIGRRFLKALEQGSNIDLLGVVLFDVNPRATTRNQATREDIQEILDGDHMLDTVIRTDRAASKDLRERHLGPEELVELSDSVRKKTLSALRQKSKVTDRLWSRDVTPLATDYQNLTREVLTRIAQAQEAV